MKRPPVSRNFRQTRPPAAHGSCRSTLLCAGTTVLAIAAVLPSCQKAEHAAPPQVPAVLFVEAPRQKVEVRYFWTGVLDGTANVDVRPHISGYILKQAYSEGALVKKGDLLFQIDPRPFEASLRQAEAAYAQSVAQQVKTQQDEARMAELVQRNSVSKQDYEHAVQANVAAKANVEAAQAVIDQAKLSLEYTAIKSEIDGVAGFALKQQGDLVGPGDPQPLTTVSTVDPIKASFQISEQEYLRAMERRAKQGKGPNEMPDLPATLILADGSRHPEPGKFINISREVNAQTGTFSVTTHFPNPQNVLRPGQFARVEVIGEALDTVVVPQRAVMETQGIYQVAIVGADNKAEIRPVQVGPRSGPGWAITGGLKEGEKVIVEGIQKVRSGMPVNASKWTPKPVEQAATPGAPAGTQPKQEAH